MKTLEKIFIFLSVVPLIGIILFPPDYRFIGDIGWFFLLGILAVHPLVDIFPNINFFKRLMPMRKSAGILCGSLLISHTLAYLVNANGLTWSNIFSSAMWNPAGYFFWGWIGIIIILALTLTSNLWSIIHLKKWWKKLHYTTYIAFFMGVMHQIFIVTYLEGSFFNNRMVSTLWPILLLVFLRALAMSGFKINLPYKEPNVVPNTNN